MNQSKLTSLQFACLLIFPMLAIFSGIGTHNIIKIAEVDSYISVLLAGIIGILPLLIFFVIFNYKEELTITEKINYLFGIFLGTFINILINVTILSIGIILIYNISNFAISQFLSETPLLVFMLVLGIILIYNVSKGIENISRVAFVFLAIIIFLTIISTIGAIQDFESSNIKPILEYGINNPIKGAISLTLTNIIPVLMLLMIPKNNITNTDKIKVYIPIFYIIGVSFMFLAIFLTIGSLGIHLSDIYQYPEYTVLKKISLFNFVDRIENFIYIKWILSSVICLSLVIYHIKESINKTSKVIIPAIITGIIIYLSLLIFKNNTIFYTISLNVFPYICLFLFIIYIIITINILIRKIFS